VEAYNVPETRPAAPERRTLSYKAYRGLAYSFLAALALACRALALGGAGLDPSLFALRVGLPALGGLVIIAFAADLALRGRRSLISGRSRRVAASAYVFTALASALDAYSGLSPYLFIPGSVVYGLLIWDRPAFLAVSSALSAWAVATAASVGAAGLGVETLSVAAVGVVVALHSAAAVKRSILPSEERMKSLEAENEELWSLSFQDTLTGLYNRRYISQVAIHMFSRAARYKEQLHVLMIDIDHFKRVNDKLGHAVGDEVLKGVAQTIQAAIRTSDTVARYGGEEFIVYMVRSDPETTQFIANRIRDGVAAVQFPGVPWTVTISIGVAGLQDGDTIEGLVDRADRFLYVSKHHGRNRVSGF